MTLEFEKETGIDPFANNTRLNKEGKQEGDGVYSNEYVEWLEDKLVNKNDVLDPVSHTLRQLNAQIELIDDILSKSGAVTRRKLEWLKESKIKDLQTAIKNSCG
jgi:hypothetical protein